VINAKLIGFGHIEVGNPDGRRLVPVLAATLAYFNCPFAIAIGKIDQHFMPPFICAGCLPSAFLGANQTIWQQIGNIIGDVSPTRL
jgi:hypothetical protein